MKIFDVICPHCNGDISVPSYLSGKSFTCTNCNNEFGLPEFPKQDLEQVGSSSIPVKSLNEGEADKAGSGGCTIELVKGVGGAGLMCMFVGFIREEKNIYAKADWIASSLMIFGLILVILAGLGLYLLMKDKKI